MIFLQTKYIVKINKGFLLLCSVFFILCCLLGVWQMHRYHYKKNLLSTYEKRVMESPVSLLESPKVLQFQSVAVDGYYENHLIMFVQNRLHESHLGYEVLTPLRIPGVDKLLLIDRGWIEKPYNALLPDLAAVKEKQHIKGYIKFLNEYQFTLGENILQPEEKPLVMQKIDINELSQLTKQPFFPFIVRLDPASANGFVRDWVISSVTPARHFMYALQWFAFATLILIAYACFSIERKRSVCDS